MKIDVGEYSIMGDSCCCWIVRNRMRKNGKPYTEKVAGYTNNIEQLLEDFIDNEARGNNARAVEGELRKIAEAEKQAKKFAEALKGEKID